MQKSVDIGSDFHPGGMVGIDDSFFISTDDRGLLHYDHTGTLTATIADVGYSFDIGASAGSVWVPDYDSGELIRIDSATDEIVARIFVAGINAHSVFATDTSVWVTTFSAGNVNVIDPATNLLTAQISAGRDRCRWQWWMVRCGSPARVISAASCLPNELTSGRRFGSWSGSPTGRPGNTAIPGRLRSRLVCSSPGSPGWAGGTRVPTG